MMRRPLVLLACVLAIAPVAAGCGSSKKSESSQTITKAAFLKKGNAICAQGNRDINAGGKRLFGTNRTKKPSTKQLKAFATTVLLPSVESQVNGIRALGAPKGDEATVKAILDAADEGVAAGKKDPLSLTKEGADPFAKANRLARAYGLKVCGG